MLGRLAWPGNVSLVNILNTFIYVSVCLAPSTMNNYINKQYNTKLFI